MVLCPQSRKLGALSIPDEYFADFVRGCIDGDGSVQTYTDRWNTFKNKKYVYERLFVQFVSASLPFLEWLHANIVRLVRVHGSVFARKRRIGRAPFWELKYAKKDSIRLFDWLYYSPSVPPVSIENTVNSRGF